MNFLILSGFRFFFGGVFAHYVVIIVCGYDVFFVRQKLFLIKEIVIIGFFHAFKILPRSGRHTFAAPVSAAKHAVRRHFEGMAVCTFPQRFALEIHAAGTHVKAFSASRRRISFQVVFGKIRRVFALVKSGRIAAFRLGYRNVRNFQRKFPYFVVSAVKNVNPVVHSVFLPIVRRICHNRQF